MSNGGKFYGGKKTSWKGYAGEGLRVATQASHLSQHLKMSVRVWAMRISGRRASQT